MQILSLAGAVIALLVMCVLAYKKMNPFVISLIGTVILIITNRLDFMDMIFGTYMGFCRKLLRMLDSCVYFGLHLWKMPGSFRYCKTNCYYAD